MKRSRKGGRNSLPQRYIAYIDILGFKSLIDKAELENKILESIQKALEGLSALQKDLKTAERPNNADVPIEVFELLKAQTPDYGREVSVFSDHIVISFPAPRNKEKRIMSLTQLLMQALMVQCDLTELSIPSRGAISIGPLYHQNGIIFGQGLDVPPIMGAI